MFFARACYNEVMNTRKKAVCLTLACAMCAAVFAAGRTPFSANAEQTDEFQPVVMTEENSEPFLPATREEYLPLQTPSHVAFSEQYTAVADGSTLYLYDKAENEYSYYEHKTGADATATTLSELQFSSDGTLYFTDQSMWLYSLDLQTKTATRQDISCSTFYIAEDYIYYTATVTGTVTFYYVPLATPADPYSTVIRQYSPLPIPASPTRTARFTAFTITITSSRSTRRKKPFYPNRADWATGKLQAYNTSAHTRIRFITR